MEEQNILTFLQCNELQCNELARKIWYLPEREEVQTAIARL